MEATWRNFPEIIWVILETELMFKNAIMSPHSHRSNHVPRPLSHPVTPPDRLSFCSSSIQKIVMGREVFSFIFFKFFEFAWAIDPVNKKYQETLNFFKKRLPKETHFKRSKGTTHLYIYWWFYPGWPWSTQSCHTFPRQETGDGISEHSSRRTPDTKATQIYMPPLDCLCLLQTEQRIDLRQEAAAPRGPTPCCPRPTVQTPSPLPAPPHCPTHTHTVTECFWTKCFRVLQAVMSDTRGKEEL